MSDSDTIDAGNAAYDAAWDELSKGDGLNSEASSADTLEPDAQGPAGAAQNADTDAAGPAVHEISDDLWANADPRIRAAYEATMDRAAKAENLVRSNEGRLTASQREAHALRTRLAKFDGKQPAQEPKLDLKANAEALAQLRAEYPEVANPLIERMEAQDRRLEQIAQADADRRAQEEAQQKRELDAYIDQQEKLLSQSHPDWSQVILGQDFVNWFSEQPLAVHNAMQRNAESIVDAKEAIWMLDLFKASKAPSPLQVKRDRQLDGSLAVPARTDTAPAGRPADDYDSEWDRLAATERRKANRR